MNNLHIIYAQVFSAAYTENLKQNEPSEAIHLAKRAAAAACDAFNCLYGEQKKEDGVLLLAGDKI